MSHSLFLFQTTFNYRKVVCDDEVFEILRNAHYTGKKHRGMCNTHIEVIYINNFFLKKDMIATRVGFVYVSQYLH